VFYVIDLFYSALLYFFAIQNVNLSQQHIHAKIARFWWFACTKSLKYTSIKSWPSLKFSHRLTTYVRVYEHHHKQVECKPASQQFLFFPWLTYGSTISQARFIWILHKVYCFSYKACYIPWKASGISRFKSMTSTLIRAKKVAPIGNTKALISIFFYISNKPISLKVWGAP
jgi:hypothetical protein